MGVAKKDIGVFRANAEEILTKGLSVMSKACDALTMRNKELEEEIESLQIDVARLKDRLLVETSERE